MMSSTNYPILLGEKNLYDLPMENSKKFEYFFIEEIARRLDEAGLSHSEFGRQVFGEHSGSRLWRAARGENRKRGLSLSEAFKMAEILGTDYPSLIWDIYQKAKKEDIIP